MALFGYPLLLAVYISFFDYFFAAPGALVDRPFVGLQNYTEILTDPAFQRSILNVIEFMLINIPLTVLLSLVLASALNAKLPFRAFFRTAYYIPYVTASVAVIGVWLWLFSGDGLVNTVLGPLAPEPSWLVNEFWAMPMIALSVTWKQLGFYVLLYLAALQNIPGELYEAAEVDGAGQVKQIHGDHRAWSPLGDDARRDPRHDHRRQPVHRTVSPDGWRRPGRCFDVAGPAHVSVRYPARQRGVRGSDRRRPRDRGHGDLRDPKVRAGKGLIMATTTAAARATTGEVRQPARHGSMGRILGILALVVGAIVFLFPFYYMVIGALQREPQTDIAGAFPNPANLTLDNFAEINASVDLARTLLNSAIFTVGVLLSTLVFGLLAGYALAQLHFRGRTVLFTVMLLILVLPFQLFMIPLYVLVVRVHTALRTATSG